MKIGILLFERRHGKKAIGSSRIRGHWLIKYWPEAESFCQGQKYDAVIFQKVFLFDYWKHYDGIKILDLCDPDWLSGEPITRGLKDIDAITTSTEELAKTVRKMTDKPVVYIPDRVDLKAYSTVKEHKEKAKSVVWFGYSHNIEPLNMALPFMKRYNLNLTVVSDKPFLQADNNIAFRQDRLPEELLKHDMAVFPEFKEKRFRFKSNNRTIQCWALGLPVATTPDELTKFLSPEERNKEGKKRRKEVEEKYDVKLSVKEMKDLICDIQKNKNK